MSRKLGTKFWTKIPETYALRKQTSPWGDTTLAAIERHTRQWTVCVYTVAKGNQRIRLPIKMTLDEVKAYVEVLTRMEGKT